MEGKDKRMMWWGLAVLSVVVWGLGWILQTFGRPAWLWDVMWLGTAGASAIAAYIPSQQKEKTNTEG